MAIGYWHIEVKNDKIKKLATFEAILHLLKSFIPVLCSDNLERIFLQHKLDYV